MKIVGLSAATPIPTAATPIPSWTTDLFSPTPSADTDTDHAPQTAAQPPRLATAKPIPSAADIRHNEPEAITTAAKKPNNKTITVAGGRGTGWGCA